MIFFCHRSIYFEQIFSHILAKVSRIWLITLCTVWRVRNDCRWDVKKVMLLNWQDILDNGKEEKLKIIKTVVGMNQELKLAIEKCLM